MIGKCVEHFDLTLVSHVLIFICYHANNETGSGGKALLSLLGHNSYSEFRAPESETNFATSMGECCSGNDVTVWRHERGISRFATSFRDDSEVTSSVLIT